MLPQRISLYKLCPAKYGLSERGNLPANACQRCRGGDPRVLAQVRARLCQDLPGSATDPSTWREPVVRLGMYTDPPFVQAANTPRLIAAFELKPSARTFEPAVPCKPIRAVYESSVYSNLVVVDKVNGVAVSPETLPLESPGPAATVRPRPR